MREYGASQRPVVADVEPIVARQEPAAGAYDPETGEIYGQETGPIDLRKQA